MILAIANSAHADDPFACVDADVADAFLGDLYSGRGEYSTTVPDGFVDLSVPPGLTLVGSRTTDSTMSVVFKASMGTDRALNAAADAMARSGWAESEQQSRRVRRGFQTSSSPTTALLICHDDYSGALSVIASDKSGQTFVSYLQHPTSQGCKAGGPNRVRHDLSETMRLMPTLNLPESARASNTGMGGNGHQVNSRADVFGAMSRSDLSSFLENQIRDQEWEFQTSWSSHHSSGSVWVLDTPGAGLLVGTLHLFDTGVDPIRVRFSVSPADPTKGEDRGSWSSISH
ncbi:MAG: hypothetical protein QNJ11_04400 [Woeseiaceae bacterium]|nr:hypothetical protein [Woeseiaceae bacterium]